MGRINFADSRIPLESKEGQLTFTALVMMMYVIAVYLAIAVHEVLGHGVFTVLFGGDFFAMYLSPGSGYISFYLPDSMTTNQIAFIYMAGILVQMALGLFVLFLVFPRVKSFIWGLFTLLFSVALLVHPSLYLFLGYFYRSGDTNYVVLLLKVQPDVFLVAGLICTGVFIILLSMKALDFVGRFIDVGDESFRHRLLMIFWLPPIILSGVSALISAFYVDQSELAYTLTNATMVLLFLTVAIFLVPVFVEPPKERDSGLSYRAVFAVMVFFLLMLTSWIGVFGLSRETAHGVMLHEPPLQAETYYRDKSIGNLDIYVYRNGTLRLNMTLRNQLEDPSPLEEQLYHTFDNRPNWDNYIARSRNMIITMFDLPREMGENLTFSTSLATVRAENYQDEVGRRCTTYLNFSAMEEGTRQINPHPGIGEGLRFEFIDPWSIFNPPGFLDEVWVSWENTLRDDVIYGENDYQEFDIPYNAGNASNNTVGWQNSAVSGSPSRYILIFTYLAADEFGN